MNNQLLKKVLKIAIAIVLLVAIGILGREELEIETLPQICQDYHGEIVCYRP